MTRITIITTTTETTKPGSRFWREYVTPHLGLFWAAVPFMLLIAAASSSYPYIVARAFAYLQSGDAKIYTLVPAVFIIAAVIKAFSLYTQIMLTNALSLRVARDLQTRLFAKVQQLDMAEITNDATGMLVARFTHDIQLVREAVLRAVTNLGRDLLTLLGALAMMLYLNWQLALVIFFLYPLASIPVIVIGRRVRAISLAIQHQTGELTSLLNESIGGTAMVRAFGLQAHEQDRAGASFLQRYQLAMQLVRNKALIDPFLEVIGAMALAAILGFAGWQAGTGVSAISDIMGMITALGILAPAARALGTLNAAWQEGMAAMSRVYALLDTSNVVVCEPDAPDLVIKNGEIVIQNLHFAYDANVPALQNINLQAKAGQSLALVGPSGGGKSTLLHLLLRFFDPAKGSICIDGQDIGKAGIESLRKQIALVGQHPVLFDDTVRANIGYGDTSAKLSAIKAAAKAAFADTFIAALPDGYETMLGENGHRLSGGQRQRIAIARAVLKNAPILLLDEATSALDSASEAKVQEALSRLARDRTTIVIAHRLSTVRDADQIAVLDAGLVTELGTHAQLLKKDGQYASLVASQLR